MIRILKISSLILILTIVCTCKKEQEQNPATDFIIYNDSKGLIGAGGGKITLNDQSSPLNGVSIDIPQGALQSPLTISINKIEKGYSFENDSTKLFVSLEPSGTTFTKPIQIGIPYNSNENADSLQVFYFDELNHFWKPVLTTNIDKTKRIALAQTTHFSIYTVAKNSVKFDLDLYKSNGKVSAKVWLMTLLLDLPTSGSTRWSSGISNVRDLISRYPSEVHAYYKIYLKEKIDYWYDKEIDSKVVVYGIWRENNFTSYEVRAKSSDGNVLLETFDKYLLIHDVELYYSGRPLVIYFPNATLDNSKQYYLEAKLYFINSWGGIDNSDGFWGTKGYFISSYDGAKSPSQMQPPPDGDGDGIVDTYDPIFGSPPLSPSNPTPVNNAVDIPTTTTLSWNCTDPDNDPLTFVIYFSTNSNPTTPIAPEQGETTLPLSSLASGMTYYWKVVAKDNHNNSTSSSVWKFKTGSLPVANFVANQTTITVGGTLNFTDQSTNSPTIWLWNFGDGATSTSQNPPHIYSTAGTYTVTLNATNNFGSDTKTLPNYITVTSTGTKPVANFVANQTTITVGGSVIFTDQSTNSPTSWSWNFGDGTNSTSQNPPHTYSNAGIYTVILTVTNSFGSDTEYSGLYCTINSGVMCTTYSGAKCTTF